MEIGARIRSVREAKGLSQGDLERATGLLRSHLSRIEHGHTIPSIGNLERIAAALGMRLYEILNVEVSPAPPTPEGKATSKGEDAEHRFLSQIRFLVGKISGPDRKLFLDFARMLARQGQTPTTWPAVKRGRGRPRKHPDNVNVSASSVPEPAAQPLSLSEGLGD
ncbi:MAG TPA: helix-turn-helix transcriptional regulator [Terriglobia bacterium]|nr:helix-turn-helix transcriptional regulator [Terriglobia bacterium]